MGIEFLPPDGARAQRFALAAAVPLKHLRQDGRITAPSKSGVEVLPPSPERAALYAAAAATPTRFLFPDGAVHDVEPGSGGEGGGAPPDSFLTGATYDSQTGVLTLLSNDGQVLEVPVAAAAVSEQQLKEAIDTEADARQQQVDALNDEIRAADGQATLATNAIWGYVDDDDDLVQGIKDGPYGKGILSTMPGVARVVYESNQIWFDSNFSMIDTGVDFEDGTNYQFIISAMEGTTGASQQTGNALRPCLINGDGTLNSLLGNTAASTLVLRALFNVRYQERIVATNPANKSVNILSGFPAQAVGIGAHATVMNGDVDAVGNTLLSVTASLLVPIIVPVQNKLRIGFAVNGIPNANARMLLKVIATSSTESTS